MQVLLIDARDSSEDGLLGLDLIRGMQMSNGVAEVTLATSEGKAGKGRLNDTIERIEGRWELEDCGCWPDVERATQKVRAFGAFFLPPPGELAPYEVETRGPSLNAFQQRITERISLVILRGTHSAQAQIIGSS